MRSPHPPRLLERFTNQVRLRPESIACECEKASFTYEQLNAASDHLADCLKRAGIGNGDRVAICMPKSSYCFVAILAVVKSGAVYLPLDPEYPEDRLSFIAQDAGVKLLLTTCSDPVPASLAEVPAIYVDSPSHHDHQSKGLQHQDQYGQDQCCQDQCCQASAVVEGNDSAIQDQLADPPVYMIYTSGSTGLPKGVVVGTTSTLNFIDAMLNAPGCQAADVVLSAATLAFDISTYDAFVPLSAGARLVVVSRDVARDGRLLAKKLSESQATILFATPSSWRMLIDSGWQGNKQNFKVYTGGEHLPRDLIQPLLDRSNQVWNFYGPTEATVLVTRQQIQDANERILVGEPIENVELTVVDEQLNPVADEVAGELIIVGTPLAHGYWNRPELDEQRFIQFQGKRAYRTGDLCKKTGQGRIECLGRIDNQVKIRGHRIELGEIEAVLTESSCIRQAVVIADNGPSGIARLIGYVVPYNDQTVNTIQVLQFLSEKLPEYMVPSALVVLQSLPLTPNGKIDRLALPKASLDRPELANAYVAPSNPLETKLAGQWSELFGYEKVGVTDNFFQLGGNSLLAVRATAAASEIFGRDLPVALLFDNPNIRQWIAASKGTVLDGHDSESLPQGAALATAANKPSDGSSPGFAIVGMAAKFPGAKNVAQFWQNLLDGVESIRFFDPSELHPSIPPNERNDKNYVAARGVIDDVEQFDPRFFGISPREAELIDPQQRVLLELAWHALEDAGFNRQISDDRVGVWAGCFANTYLTQNLLHDPDRLSELSEFQLATCTEKDFIATRIAHHLDLRGPAINVNTACSTSLVAIIEACKSLQNGDCELAIAGGSTIVFPQYRGHVYQSGNILSPDGHCRPFDAAADGTLFSDGAGLVVLKRLDDAVRDGNRIYAVIRGLGINNDGGKKASFSAPSMQGQAAAIRMAHQSSGVPVESIQYVEAHGTATPLGDPIEVAALAEAFQQSTDKKQFCALGSVKSNIGHCVAAAGVAGLIKAALALYHQQIPATLHYRKENPSLKLNNTPFFICDKRLDWPRTDSPRYAGVSSFGVGGTNAHVVLAEAPVNEHSLSHGTQSSSQPVHLWPLSAKTVYSRDQLESAFVAETKVFDPSDVAAVATTLQHHREAFSCRSFAILDSTVTPPQAFQERSKRYYGSAFASANPARLTWMFPGQGSQYAGMGRDLYNYLPVFRRSYDNCCEILKPIIGLDLRDLMLAQFEEAEETAETLQNTRITQPAIYALSYSLAQVWLAAGLQPDRLIGHSIGEFVAATVAGVFDFETAIKLVALRGDLVSKLPRGQMLSVLASPEQLIELLPPGCEIAAINAPKLCVAAGPFEAIAALKSVLQEANIGCRQLLTSHAFHSSMMDSAINPFQQQIEQTVRRSPTVPILSTVTGKPLTDQQALSASYWAEHLRKPVLFSQTIGSLLPIEQPETFLEIGPRSTLVTLARKQFKPSESLNTIPSLSESATRHEELRSFLYAVGSLWSLGNQLNWEVVSPATARSNQRFKGWLPEYPFDRKRLFIEPKTIQNQQAPQALNSASSPMSTANKSGRINQLVSLVREIFENASGIEIPANAIQASYLELGFDSLMLTQIAASLQRKFEVEITFRQLLEQLHNVELLVEWLDNRLPADKFAEEQSVKANSSAISQNAPQITTSSSSATSAPPAISVPSATSALTASNSSAASNSSIGSNQLTAATQLATVTTQSAANAMLPAQFQTMHSVAQQGGVPNSIPIQQALPQTTPLATPIPAVEGNALQSIVQQQLQLMQCQLQLLSGVQVASAPIHVPSPELPAAVSTYETAQPGPVSSQSSSGIVQPHQPVTTLGTAASSTAVSSASASSKSIGDDSRPDSKKAFGAQARVSLQSANIDSQLEHRLRQFIEQYNNRTGKSKAYAQRHRRQLADPRTVSGFQPATKELTYPIVVERSKGAYLYDLDGHQYIDLTCGYGSNFFGHSPDFMVEALSKQIATGYEIGPQSVLTGEVAELFCELTGNQRVAFCNTGSEAVLGAVRLARTVTGRDKVVMFTGDYHGILDEVIVRPNKKQVSFPAAPGIPGSAVQNMVVLEYGTDESLQRITQEIDQYAAVLVESVQSRRPDYQPREFLHKLRQLTQDRPTALIFDEVITGFRAGLRGAQGFYGVEADLATYGKVIGGGMPIGVIAGKAHYMDALDGGFWQFGDDSRPEVGMTYFAGTFVRHPLALAAAKQTLLYLKQHGPQAYQHLQSISDRLEAGLCKIFSETGAPLRIARFCSLIKPEFTEETQFGDLLFAAARRRGLHVWEHRPWFLTLAHTEKDIDQVLQIMRESIDEVQELGFLPCSRRPQHKNSMSDVRVESKIQPKLGKDRDGKPGWFIPDALNPGQFIQVPDPSN